MFEILIGTGSPDTATLSVSISTIFHRLGEEDEISMEGVAARRQVSLKETSYYGNADGESTRKRPGATAS